MNQIQIISKKCSYSNQLTHAAIYNPSSTVSACWFYRTSSNRDVLIEFLEYIQLYIELFGWLEFEYACYISMNSSFLHVIFLFRIIYEYCCKGRDLLIWYKSQETQNKNEISGIDELTTIINDFITKHIKEEVLKVKLHKENYFNRKKLIEIVSFLFWFLFNI